MPEEIFQFKQFSVAQDRCAMKVGTDAILLGAWVDPSMVKNILDIGTGTGILSLMMAQRSEAEIEAVEIDKSAFLQATENFKSSPWSNRIHCHHNDIRDLILEREFDLIVSNPPYFLGSSAGSDQREKARSSNSLELETLFKRASELCTEDARVCIVYPFEQRTALIKAALNQGWILNRSAEIYSKPETIPVRVLVEFSKNGNGDQDRTSLTVRNADGSYHEDYMALTKDYHTIF